MTCPPSTSLSPICREQVYGGISGGTTVPGPRLRYPKCPMPPVPTPSSTRSSVACLTSLHPVSGGPCRNRVEWWDFSAVVPHSESVSTCQRPEPRRRVPTQATAAFCFSPAACRRRRTRCTRRRLVSPTHGSDQQPLRAQLEEHTPAVVFARQGISCQCLCPVAPPKALAPPLTRCLTMQHRISTARSDVMVGSVVGVTTPVWGMAATCRKRACSILPLSRRHHFRQLKRARAEPWATVSRSEHAVPVTDRLCRSSHKHHDPGAGCSAVGVSGAAHSHF